ncbi:MAG: hypothetical protein HN725_18770 [Alphaproteobacteria bacterium]|jgi:hypothetical protein|nr:hypothetical protein [Alphaproteobacteria bacterium]MBT4086789.1 hypothetical protein [Alphaproteobacteria bacterium]MBT4542460.1 hypothetical protein [Alphaproteobacteria bacterium]MBT7747338.1 hypothetical protein [Alphaproteobacteria bacterium]
MPLLRNPTEDQVADRLKGYQFMRVLRNKGTGDFLAWPDHEGLHADIMREQGLT